MEKAEEEEKHLQEILTAQVNQTAVMPEYTLLLAGKWCKKPSLLFNMCRPSWIILLISTHD